MNPDIIDLQSKVRLRKTRIKVVTQSILKLLKVKEADLSLVFVTDRKIKALNKKFLNREYTTDVLAFDMNCCSCGGPHVAGEIVISVDAAARNAREYQTSPARELALYIIHGILHLAGYDDHKKADIRKMRRRELELLTLLDRKIDGILGLKH